MVTYSLAKEHHIKNWLKNNRVNVNGVFIAKNKSDLSAAELFIDDSPRNSVALSEVGKKTILIKKWHYKYGNGIERPNITQA